LKIFIFFAVVVSAVHHTRDTLVIFGLNTQLTSLSLIESAAIFATASHIFPVVLTCWKPVHLLSVAGMVHKELFCRDFETRQWATHFIRKVIPCTL